jgi:hypothetical protein
MVITLPKNNTTPEYRKAWLLGFLMIEYLPAVMPGASIAERRKVADEAMLVLAGKREEDRGFRRVNEMCAARPLGAGRFREDQ